MSGPSEEVVYASGAQAIEDAQIWQRAETGTCTLGQQTLAVGSGLVVLGILILGLRLTFTKPAKGAMSTEAAAALSTAMVPQLIALLSFTLMILESYSLCEAMDKSAAFSGFLIGLYQLFVPVGNGFLYILLRRSPRLWKHRPRAILSVSLLGMIVGALLYMWGCMYAGQSGAQEFFEGGPEAVLMALGASRVVSGFCAGVINQLNSVSILHLAPKEERPELTTRLYLANMVGIGGGPAMAAAASATLDALGVGAARSFGQAGALQAAAAGAALLAVLARYPVLGGVPDMAEEDTSSKGAEAVAAAEGGGRARRKALLITGCLLMTVNRSCVVASLEAATAMLLEEKYFWARREIGLMVGLSFLLSIPLKLIHGSLKHRLSVPAWIRLLAGIAAVGSLLFFPAAGGSAFSLILADAVLFPSLYLSDGMSVGVLFQNGFPEGSWFDAKTLVLWQSLLGCGVGRFFGPWSARSTIEGGGQDAYAKQQILLCLVFLFTFEAFVLPGMQQDGGGGDASPLLEREGYGADADCANEAEASTMLGESGAGR
mmetsp:Transcript_16302/g.56914  ORF Transcript_16302/g.56914 Transcript_16302/m.56914 type:complete len:545 (-) Transcript_16302:136-1770(-)